MIGKTHRLWEAVLFLGVALGSGISCGDDDQHGNGNGTGRTGSEAGASGILAPGGEDAAGATVAGSGSDRLDTGDPAAAGSHISGAAGAGSDAGSAEAGGTGTQATGTGAGGLPGEAGSETAEAATAGAAASGTSGAGDGGHSNTGGAGDGGHGNTGGAGDGGHDAAGSSSDGGRGGAGDGGHGAVGGEVPGGGGRVRNEAGAGGAASSGECPVVYNDTGILFDTDIFTWSLVDWEEAIGEPVPVSEFEGEWTDCGDVPEGTECFRTVSGADMDGRTNYAGWGVFGIEPTLSWDVSWCEQLTFWVMPAGGLSELELGVQQVAAEGQDPENAPKATILLDGLTPDVWQQLSIPADQFEGVDLAQTYGLFLITAVGGEQTFFVDDVRWE
jgi:hypothetical protein